MTDPGGPVADDNPYPQRTHPGDPRPSDAASESGQGAGAGPSAPSGADGRGQGQAVDAAGDHDPRRRHHP